MSDQDFFFDDDEPKPTKSTKSAKAAPGRTSASGSSKPSVSSSKSPAKNAPAKDAVHTPVPSGGFMDQSMSMPIVSLLVVIGLLVGVIVGFLIGGGMQSQTPAITGTGAIGAGTTGTGTTGGATTNPGQLTPEQIQKGLPSGHPAVGGATGATGTPAP